MQLYAVRRRTRSYEYRGRPYGTRHRLYGGRSGSYGVRTDSYGVTSGSYGRRTESYGVRTDSYGGRTDAYEGRTGSYGNTTHSYGPDLVRPRRGLGRTEGGTVGPPPAVGRRPFVVIPQRCDWARADGFGPIATSPSPDGACRHRAESSEPGASSQPSIPQRCDCRSTSGRHMHVQRRWGAIDGPGWCPSPRHPAVLSLPPGG